MPRGETRDPWTVKDSLAHITYWKSCVTLSARGERLPPENRLNINEGNRVVYLRWKRRSPKEVLAWHRQVHRDLLKALPRRPARGSPRLARPGLALRPDGHSAGHRVRDLERALHPPQEVEFF